MTRPRPRESKLDIASTELEIGITFYNNIIIIPQGAQIAVTRYLLLFPSTTRPSINCFGERWFTFINTKLSNWRARSNVFHLTGCCNDDRYSLLRSS